MSQKRSERTMLPSNAPLMAPFPLVNFTQTNMFPPAERFQEGRVFLLGDATHTMPPYLGLGVNTAIGSVQNLAWKLGAVLTGPAAVLFEKEMRGSSQLQGTDANLVCFPSSATLSLRGDSRRRHGSTGTR